MYLFMISYFKANIIVDDSVLENDIDTNEKGYFNLFKVVDQTLFLRF